MNDDSMPAKPEKVNFPVIPQSAASSTSAAAHRAVATAEETLLALDREQARFKARLSRGDFPELDINGNFLAAGVGRQLLEMEVGRLAVQKAHARRGLAEAMEYLAELESES